ncbi:MAG: polysaccharide deacetylase family protein [Pseudomonadota bacterium]
MSTWAALAVECAAWKRARLPLRFWWRDDDAVRVTPALERLCQLTEDTQTTAHLAVIPSQVQSALVTLCTNEPRLVPLVHGWAHQNHAPRDEKKAEFGHPRPGLEDDAARALTEMRLHFGGRFLPCFVPPWNRITPQLVQALPEMGYVLLSTFTARARREPCPGLVQINTHVDPIHWRGGGGLVDPARLLALAVETLQRQRQSGESPEPLGLLTHHLVQDDATWSFTRDFISALQDGGAEPLNLYAVQDALP